MKESYEADFENTSKTGIGLKKSELSHDYLRNVTLTSTSDFRLKFLIKFKEKDIYGQRAYSKLFHSAERNNTLKYNNWNFTTGAVWDSNVKNKDGQYTSFWYSINTTFLFETETFLVGKEQVELMNCRAIPEENIWKNKYSGFSLFGFIPLNYIDKEVLELVYIRTPNLNEDQLVDLRNLNGTFNSSNIVTNILPEFTKRKYILQHYTISDLFARIGGLMAALAPIINNIEPLFYVYFFWKLANIVGDKIGDAHANELRDLAQQAREQFRVMHQFITLR